MKHKLHSRRIVRAAGMMLFATLLVTATASLAMAQTNTFPSSGNAGIGTTSPVSPLEVQALDSPITLSQSGVAAKSTLQAIGGTDLHLSANAKYSSSAWNRYDTSKPSWNFFLAPSTGADFAGVRRVSAGSGAITWTDLIRVTSSGNVGIGTTAPGEKLDILDNTAGASGPRIRLLTTDTTANKYSGYQFNSGSTFKGGLFRVLSNDDLQIWTAGDTTNARVTFQNGGNVGIGTTSPAKKLHIFGTNSQVFVDRAANTAGNYALVNFATNGVQKFFFGMNADSDVNADKLSFFDAAFSANTPVMTLTGGNVGVGTTTPAYKLHVNGAINATSLNVNGAAITSSQWTTSGSNINYATAGGNVGIGQSNPTYKLDVNGTAHVSGNMTVDGNINAKYQDVAEWVPSAEQLSAGTVVVLDPTKSNEVIASTHEYDTRVAGVVSAQPGITLGERGEGKVLVATTGRVRVKVDASRGAIQVGDLLVTSDIPGVAMKSEPINVGGVQIHRPGTLIGKALEPLEKGQGEILVLLSLQ